jgi:hypothetical protein
MDYVLETALRIGVDDSVYIPFEGKVVRWINGTPERDAIASISVADVNNHTVEDEKLNRLLTVLVWDHNHPIRRVWGVGGGRSPYAKVYSPRKAAGLQVDLTYLVPKLREVRSETQWLALALYREAQNSTSTFYEYLCYWKILDRVFPRKADKQAWLKTVAVPRLAYLDRMKEILASNADVEKYFRERWVNAIKHVMRDPVINPDKPDDLLAITKDTHLMEDVAKLVMRDELKL